MPWNQCNVTFKVETEVTCLDIYKNSKIIFIDHFLLSLTFFNKKIGGGESPWCH